MVTICTADRRQPQQLKTFSPACFLENVVKEDWILRLYDGSSFSLKCVRSEFMHGTNSTCGYSID